MNTTALVIADHLILRFCVFCEHDTEHNMKGLTAVCTKCGAEGSMCDDQCLGCHA